MEERRGFLKKLGAVSAGITSLSLLSTPSAVPSSTPETISSDRMKVAFVLFNGITMLDFVGFYDPVSRLKSQGYIPNLSWDFCSFTDTVQDSFGLSIGSTRVRQSLDAYDLIFVPGGFGTRALLNDRDFLNWLKTAQNVPHKISVCTGSLLLGAAGFLQDRMATTNFKEYERLKQYCPNVQKVRIVEDRNVITAGAVAASLDLGLYVCEKFAGVEAREAIRANMDYPKVEVSVKKV